MFSAFCDVKRTLVKLLLEQRDLPLKMNISLNGCELKVQQNDCLRCWFWQKMKTW